MDACKRSPSSTRGVLTVGSIDRNDQRFVTSNFGECVSLFAPGVDIKSTFLNDGIASKSGTSFAAPHVSGIIALLLSQYPNRFESVEKTFDYVKKIATKNRLSRTRNSVNLLAYNGFVEGEEQNPAPSKPIDYSDWTNLGEDDFISVILEETFNVNQIGPDKITPLVFAIRSSYEDAIPILLRRNANVNAGDNLEMTPLFFAIKLKQFETIELLILNGASIDRKDSQGNSYFYSVLPDVDLEMAEYLIHKVALCAKNNKGKTILQDAILLDKIEIAKLIIEKYPNDCKIDTQDEEGKTALHDAVMAENLELMEILLTKNANINQKTFDGDTPLHSVILLYNPEIAKWLIDRHADIHAKNNNGETPLLLCVYHNRVKIAGMLIAKDDRVLYDEKAILLHVNSVEMAQLLINAANAVLLDKFMKDVKVILSRLVRYDDFILRTVEFHGKTLLQLAITRGHLELANEIIDQIKVLKKRRIEFLSIVNAKCKSHKTALDYAKSDNQVDIANRLVDLGAK